ncbi:MAG: hypothetical protein QM765_34965 [Myxococcales bacterium]
MHLVEQVTLEAPMSMETLSREEIARRYPNEWVCLEGYDGSNMDVREGVVVAHHPSRKQLFSMVPIEPLKRRAFIFTGERPVVPFWAGLHVDDEI